MGKLKPCPFCGESATIERYGTSRYGTLYSCDFCGCYLETGEEWDHGGRWNNRPLEDAKDAQIKELRDALESQPKWESCSIENGDSDMPHDSADYYLVQLGDEEGFVDEPYIDYIDTCADTGFTWFANDTERLAKAYLPIHTPKLTEELK